MISKNASGSSSSHERGASRLIRPKPLFANEAEENGSADSDEDEPEKDAAEDPAERPEDPVEDAEENEMTEDSIMQEGGEEAQTPRTMCSPCKPSTAEVILHRKTHLPFRSWCKVCVQGRGRRAAQVTKVREDTGIPMIGLDYFFIGDDGAEGEDSKEKVAAVAMRDYFTKALIAHVVPAKGVEIEWTARQIVSDLERLGYKDLRIVVRSDQERAISALVDRIKELRRGETEVEWSPRYDKNANGFAERAV